MTLTDFFAYLGAPLANKRWSWGAVRLTDGAVFLRVWQDEQKKMLESWYSKVTFGSFYADHPLSLGHAERMRHLDLIRNGASSYLVMCQALDVKAHPRQVKSFDQRDVFVGGNLLDVDNDYWLERSARRPASEVRLRVDSL